MPIDPCRALRRAGSALLAGLMATAPLAPTAASIAGEADITRPAPATDSRFVRTALQAEAQDPELAAQFAATAIEALTAAYAGEADLAREEALAGGGAAQLLDWARAVERYAGQVAQLRKDIDAGYPVRFLPVGDRNLGVSVGDRTVILSHPRTDAQPAFEQAVLGTFCRARACEQWTGQGVGTGPGSEPIPVSAGRVRPVWTFSNDGAICAHGGLEVHFSAGFDIGRARDTCTQFMHEAQTLAVEVRWQYRHAVRIDWDGLQLSASPGRPGHTLRLNRAGDALIATLPLIYSSPGLLDSLLPWVRAQLGGEEPAVVVLRARDFGWEGG